MKATTLSAPGESETEKRPSGPIWLFVAGMLLPTLITWIYFELLAGQASRYQQLAMGLGKGGQIVLIALAFWFRRGAKATTKPEYGQSALVGLVFGGIVCAAMGAIYFLILLPNGVMDGPRTQAMKKVAEFGVATPMALVGLGVFYSLIHSGFEEIYWRWFVFGELDGRVSLAPAAVISGLGFMSHHLIVLARYFGWSSPLTWLFALGIVVGGASWAVIYRRWGTLLGPWLSHLLVDAAIFAIGYHLLFGVAAP